MALIIPDADEIAYYATGYMTGYNLDTLDSLSPTLPMNFDRNYLPSILLPNTENLCEKQLINLSKCVMVNHLQLQKPQRWCQFFVSRFEICRRTRDVQILKAIKQWETDQLTLMDAANRDFYVMGLTKKKQRLSQTYEAMLSNVEGYRRQKQLIGEINTLNWRIKYIKKLIEKDNKPNPL